MIGVALALLFLTFIYIFWKKRERRIPPGPTRLPLLGSIPFLTIKKGLSDWVLDEAVTKHKIATVGLGPRIIYVINDYVVAKELLNKEELTGRHLGEFAIAHRGFNGKRYGIFMNEGKQWLNQKRFGLKTLKDLGFGRQSLEQLMNIEFEEMLNKFLSTKEDFLLGIDFNVPIINILWQLVAGKRFDEDDPEGMEMVASVNGTFKDFLKMNFLPLIILKTFSKITSYEENVKIFNIQKGYIFKQIEEHEKTRDPEHPRDFIDVYLHAIENDIDGSEFTKEDLATSMLDFLHAGTETSSTTLKWIVLYLTIYPDVQERCRKEIVSLIGSSLCSVSDMINLPFVQATISEVLRISRLAPLSLGQRNLVATNIDDFSFPAGSLFFANLSYIMMDPDKFFQPELFNPDRFLGPTGRYEKKERMVSFGIGKRACVGELLARNEVFLFTVNLIQKLRFLPPDNHPAPDCANYHCSVTSVPDDFYLKFVSV